MPAEIINEKEDDQIVAMPGAPLGMTYLPMLPEPEEIAELEMVSGFSDMRNALLLILAQFKGGGIFCGSGDGSQEVKSFTFYSPLNVYMSAHL